ncbi:response regulator [Deinococcus malanensis]|uniref:Response regulator n=1 Tax=Deinococcus malanensis TaxID=1706855 RepID=A0ABQ2EZJ8_9DEIO|nr:response regulator [Deinococcus malanensis]GGK35306.1 response regulator [Deinococcus malanensis]
MVQRLHLLLVEDSTADLFLAQEVFEAHKDRLLVTTHQNGADAVAFLKQPPERLPDVVLMDLHMPGLNGIDVLKIIKADPALAHLPVVLMSGSAKPAEVVEAYQLQASAFLIKAPGFPQQMTAFVTYWLQAQVTSPSS